MPSWLRKHGDALLAAVVAAVYIAEVSFEADVNRRGPSALVALGFGASLLVRKRYPLVPLLAGLAVIELDNTALKGLAEAGIFLVGFIIALYSAGRWARNWVLVAASLLTLAAIPLAAIEPGQPVGFGDVAFFTVFFGAPIVAGRLFRYRSERERVLVDRTATLELEQEVRAAEAVAEERGRIARELHDVVAHAISVIVVQARGGRHVLNEEPAEAGAALEAIERAGEQALVEMRRLLGVLRSADERAALAPQPGLARLGELAGQVAAAGLPVEVDIEGTPVELPPGIDVSAYRIVQEALTNALKHAGPAHASVVVRYEVDALELEVVDDGAGIGEGGGSGQGAARHPRACRHLRRRARERAPGRGRLPHPRAAALGGAMIRVLLADDQSLVRAGFRMILRAEHDIEVIGEAGNGREAVDRTRDLRPDVVLMDIRMPELDGIEATRRITALESSSRVLVLTTFDLDEYVYESLRAGASAFLLKDAPEEQLVAAVRVVADGGSLFGPSVTRRLIEEFARPAATAPPPALAELTGREQEVFRLVARGRSNAEIAAELVVSEHTAKTHVASILQKLDLRNRVQAVVLAYEWGLVRPGS